MPAELSGPPGLADVLAQLPHLTVHLVELPGRWWVADPTSMTCWVHKSSTVEERAEWTYEAGAAILSAQGAALTQRASPRLRSVR